MTATDRAVELVEIAAAAASDKLASDIIAYDVSDQLVITDAFLLCSASNDRQVHSIVDEIEDRLRKAGAKPVRREGEREGRWVLLDYVDIVVHVQHAEERVYYALERLWKDCPVIPLPEPVGAGRRGIGRRAPAARAERSGPAPSTPARSADPWNRRNPELVTLVLWRHGQTVYNAQNTVPGPDRHPAQRDRARAGRRGRAVPGRAGARRHLLLRPQPRRRDRRRAGPPDRPERQARRRPARARRRRLGGPDQRRDPQERYPDAYAPWSPPDGEPVAEVTDRASGALLRIADAMPGGSLASW